MKLVALKQRGEVSRAPARAALALAIEARNAAEIEKGSAASALATFEKNYSETLCAWSLAGDAVQEAKNHLDDRLRVYGGNEESVDVDAARHCQPSPRQALADAKLALVDKKERLDLAKQGQITVRSQALAAEETFDFHRWKVIDAAREVLREPLADLLGAARKVQAQAFAMRSIVRHVASGMDGVTSNWNNVQEGLAFDVRRFLNSGVGDNDEAAIAPWEVARMALLHDPDAPLPEIIP